ncbi:helix-turn-helix transcriptional regulator [Georgenia sp. Z1344]|uniref:helix-turn-helix transcriptional regulator n=1 Tax=Georgenia sp. Z1344 TaxID=3416706 RepID=UPI003CE99760
MVTGENRQLESRFEYVRAIQSAVSVDEVRRAYHEAVSLIIPADGIGMYRFASPGVPALFASNLSDEFMAAYEAEGRNDDPVLDAVTDNVLPADSTNVVREQRWLESGARAVLLRENLAHSLEAPILIAGEVAGTVNFARATDAEPFTLVDLTTARFVSEHLSLALERARRFEQAGDRAALLGGALDHLSQMVVVADATSGERVFASRNLEVRFPESAHGLIDSVVADFVAEGRRALTANVRDDASGERLIIKCSIAPTYDAIIAVVFEAPDEEDCALPAWEVLSPREQEIAEYVSKGMTTKEIADIAFVSQNTVKQHIKRIFAKTGVHSRAELVHLIWASRGHDRV